MTHSENATKLVARFEGLRLRAYQDGNGIWTIGYGHTGPEAFPGAMITAEQALQLLGMDLGFADSVLARLVKVPINQNQYDALVSLVYNIGEGQFSRSTCLRELNRGNAAAACAAIGMFDIVARHVSPGLVRRRRAEQELFAA